ncbi:XRE family transcriptional regulator [Hoeflea prorocentri]|uniref:Helix-turn-helix domain-containing protein n=1 Tax=Hoeflea prorocentri TaxID=1922333 RepID=A0A9X3UGT5_9HYPH|nr:S24 family peptidase [Hoeflea prorocentri]MCY6381047.1 helix-turn-helix domain-containing protein [Hoeflea prorocentri]MDA5398847.1 helix-turn-helix domain-containing protein [Hoeflea prorocentri]
MITIRSLREAKGLTQARLAELAQTSQPQIRRLEAGERQLTKDWAMRLAPHLDISPSELMFGGQAYDPPLPSGPPAGGRSHDITSAAALDRTPPYKEHKENKYTQNPEFGVADDGILQSNNEQNDLQSRHQPSNARLGSELPELRVSIPVYGQAVGGVDGEFVMNGDRLEDVFAPPSLSSVVGAYAVYVAGESMEPRYFDGEIVFVNPVKRVRRGDFVVAQVKTQEHGPTLAYVKRFLRWNAEELVLSQYNPEKELRFAASQVVSVHLVVMGGAV